jgi:nucleotide-binding universal stress UspA family protein
MRILVAVDRSEYSEIVLEHGFDQAVRLGADSLHFVTVVDRNADLEPARTWLDRAIRDLDLIETFRWGDREITLHVRCGQPAAMISALAGELRPDLLVIGRFHSPSTAEVIGTLVESPTLVVGVEGHDLEPQCPDCRSTRRESDGERLFCEAHEGNYLPDLVTRVPPYAQLGSRLW